MKNPIVTLRAAAELANVSVPTILYWCREYGVGVQAPGSSVWLIDPEKLKEQMEKRAK